MCIRDRDNGGVFFVPAFTGLGAPHWNTGARGMIIGITAATSKEQITRAALESMAYQTRDLLEEMCIRDRKQPLNNALADALANLKL